MNFEQPQPRKERTAMENIDTAELDVLYSNFEAAIVRAKGGGNNFNYEQVLAKVLDGANIDLGQRMLMNRAIRERYSKDHKEAA